MIPAAQWLLYYDMFNQLFMRRQYLYNTFVALVVELRNCPVSDTNCWSSTPVLCSVSHLIFPWLKSLIIMQSPLLTSVIALCIFSLFCLAMLEQRYTTPMVTVVCPVTNLHHMASLQSASSCNFTTYVYQYGQSNSSSHDLLYSLRHMLYSCSR